MRKPGSIGRGRSALAGALALLVLAAGTSGVERTPAASRAVAIDPRVLDRLLPEAESDEARAMATAAFHSARVRAGTPLPTMRYVRELARLQRVLPQTAPGAFQRDWRFLGPANVGGRIRTIVIHPQNPDVMYTGGVAGGVFKSTDAGATWKPITERFGHVAVSSIAMDPKDPEVLYVSTGEDSNSRPPIPSAGIGLLKSTDGGASWRLIPSTVTDPRFKVVFDVVISHNDSRVLYAATLDGVLRSVDAGLTWELVHQGRVSGYIGCEDLVVRTDRTPDHLFASCPYHDASSVFRSMDGGATWEPTLQEALPAGTLLPVGFAALAVAPSNQDVVYASVSNQDSSSLGVFRSNQAGAPGSWTQVGDRPLLDYCRAGFGQGNYANAIAVDPTNPERVWVGGIDAYRSEDGGATFKPAGYWYPHQEFGMDDGSPYVHADHHTIVFHPRYDGSGNQTVYFGTDGGVFRTQNDRAPTPSDDCEPGSQGFNEVVYDSLNEGLAITQFWGGSVSDDGTVLTGGTQDNGTYVRAEGGGPNDWQLVYGGDGMKTAIAPDKSYYYAERPGNDGINIARSPSGQNQTYQEITFGKIRDKGLFVTPFVLDPNNPRVIWTGGSKMWKSEDAGDTWIESSPVLVQPGQFSGIASIAVAPSNSEVVYVGTTDGRVFLTTNAGTRPPTWTDVTGSMPVGEEARIGGIAVDPTNPAVAYVTHTFFGTPKVFKTTDSGASWTNIDGVLPDVPVMTVAINPRNPQMVFLGTDIGVFESPNGGATWLPSGSNVPGIYIMELQFRRGTGELYVFTHGRGVYMVDVGA